MRLSLLMEIERRKQAEEALHSVRSQWQTLREKLATVGINLPTDFPGLSDDNKSDVDPAEDICQQLHVSRFVSESVGRATLKAEVEAEMKAQLEAKNFEIARLSDRLHYYETMNREMSQRNQEAIGEFHFFSVSFMLMFYLLCFSEDRQAISCLPFGIIIY